jgi:hypothetical protein
MGPIACYTRLVQWRWHRAVSYAWSKMMIARYPKKINHSSVHVVHKRFKENFKTKNNYFLYQRESEKQWESIEGDCGLEIYQI